MRDNLANTTIGGHAQNNVSRRLLQNNFSFPIRRPLSKDIGKIIFAYAFNIRKLLQDIILNLQHSSIGQMLRYNNRKKNANWPE